MTTREAEVQKAREELIRAEEWIGRQDEELCWPLSASYVGQMLAAYAAHSLRVELGELAKEMCVFCNTGIPMGSEHWHKTDGKWVNHCNAAPLRRRMAELEEEG